MHFLRICGHFTSCLCLPSLCVTTFTDGLYCHPSTKQCGVFIFFSLTTTHTCCITSKTIMYFSCTNTTHYNHIQHLLHKRKLASFQQNTPTCRSYSFLQASHDIILHIHMKQPLQNLCDSLPWVISNFKWCWTIHVGTPMLTHHSPWLMNNASYGTSHICVQHQ